MRRTIALIMAVFFALALCACSNGGDTQTATDEPSKRPRKSESGEAGAANEKNAEKKAEKTAVRLDYIPSGKAVKLFTGGENFVYTGGAKVPDYNVSPNMANVINKNQYIRGTDAVGDYYYASQLSGGAIGKIEQNGFVVLDYDSRREYFSIYESNRYNYVPSFITTDSAVHTFHLMYDFVLKSVERDRLGLVLGRLSDAMAEESFNQYGALKGTDFENAALRNAAFFSVGSKLLNSGFNVRPEVSDLVNAELALIAAHDGTAESPVVNYGQSNDAINSFKNDYSQFIPRGHYTQSKELTDYFNASMWYGLVTFRAAFEDEARSALLMTSALQREDLAHDWSVIYQTINFFVGECDDITPADFTAAIDGIYGEGLGRLEEAADSSKFTLAAEAMQAMPAPQINSVPVFEASMQPDRDMAVKGLRFLGQRFTVDAAIFQRLMDRETSGRQLPSSLDIPAAFGSEEAFNILAFMGEPDRYPDYAGNMAKVKDYVSKIDDGTWTSNLYWSWLNTLRPLAANTDRAGYPFFMRNAAWTRKELNTFLGSWSELKHDTVLYSKQPMAEKGGGGEDVPPPPDDRGYVEPNPELFARLALLVEQTRDGLISSDLITVESSVALGNLGDIAGNLRDISQKELADAALSQSDYDFIRAYGGELEHIWDVAKKDEIGDNMKDMFLWEHPDAIVSDVATSAYGEVLEEATGLAKVIVTAFPRDGEVVLGRGVVFSQYEFTMPSDRRMTVEQWHARLNDFNAPPPQAAEWKAAYTAEE